MYLSKVRSFFKKILLEVLSTGPRTPKEKSTISNLFLFLLIKNFILKRVIIKTIVFMNALCHQSFSGSFISAKCPGRKREFHPTIKYLIESLHIQQ
jgi:hypothetical protein